MGFQDERRSGKDRRHRFLNGLDRRKSPPPFFVLGFDSIDPQCELPVFAAQTVASTKANRIPRPRSPIETFH